MREQIKSLLSATAAAIFSPLPSRMKRSVAYSLASTMTPSDRYLLTSHLAGGINIARFTVAGRYGLFESLSNDDGVLRLYAVDGTWASRSLKLITDAMEGTDGTYIDIGANIGLTVVPVARLGVNCFAFEPEPHNFESLTRNVARNVESAKLQLFQLALSDVSGEARLSLAKGNLGDHRLVGSNASLRNLHPDTEQRQEIVVPTERLDRLKVSITDPLIVKLDAQGAEPMILRGGRETLSRAKLLVMEFSPFHISKFQDTADDLLDFLGSAFKDIAYGIGESDQFNFGTSKSDVISFLQAFFRKNTTSHDNYLDIAATNF
jgi:FkbM family methyltransferase